MLLLLLLLGAEAGQRLRLFHVGRTRLADSWGSGGVPRTSTGVGARR